MAAYEHQLSLTCPGQSWKCRGKGAETLGAGRVLRGMMSDVMWLAVDPPKAAVLFQYMVIEGGAKRGHLD